MKTNHLLPVALGMLLPLAAHAQPGTTGGNSINAEIRQELSDARKEVRVDLAKARRELDTENLRIDNSVQFGHRNKAKTNRDADKIPSAEITPDGDFLIGGKVQDIDTSQRRELLAYRGLVIEIAKSGIDIGQKSAEVALNAVDGSWVALMFGAMTGSLERRIERTVREEIEPGVRGICRMLPRVMSSQQRLATNLPQFKPYATLERKDVDECENDIRREFASR